MTNQRREDRLHPEEGNQPSRSPFERDRDRVLYSDAFRRLADVTQVVAANEGRFFHNRLTHSLKVAQFGRRLTQRLLRDRPSAALSADVVETACLAHDLGHPPFGHIAEDELDEQVKHLAKVEDGFEGNAQSFRVVTRLALRRTGVRGLNLTRATLNAVLKYPWSRTPTKKDGTKWGHYKEDQPSFEFARGLGPRGDARSIEAEIMDWSDDVTYAVHDMEDSYRAGMVPLDQLLAGGAARDSFVDSLEKESRKRADRFLDALKHLDVPELHRPFDGSSAQRGTLNWFSSQLINRFILAAKLKGDTLELPSNERFEVDTLKLVMKHFVFGHPALAAQQHGQRRVIRELFTTFWSAATSSKDHERKILPVQFRELLNDASDKTARARLVADLIAGMTERDAISIHQRLTGTALGTVLDSIWS
ncbi:MAG: dNTP triphosphohydrolase [Myxococcus sp.]|nr:dNTP triphosphohydrolase [Myxococcus sp.]